MLLRFGGRGCVNGLAMVVRRWMNTVEEKELIWGEEPEQKNVEINHDLRNCPSSMLVF